MILVLWLALSLPKRPERDYRAVVQEMLAYLPIRKE